MPLRNLTLHIIFIMGSYLLGTVHALTQQSTPCTDCPSGPYSDTCNNCFVTTVKKLTCNCMHNTYEYKISSIIIDDSATDCNENAIFMNCDGQLRCGACPAPIQEVPENKKEKKNKENNNKNRSSKENESKSSSQEETTKKKDTRKKTKRPEEKPRRKKEEL